MPLFGKDSKKKELIKNLGTTYDNLQREYQISPGDFPDLKKMQQNLLNHDFSKFNTIKPRLLETVDKMLVEDISKLMEILPLEETNSIISEPLIKGEKENTKALIGCGFKKFFKFTKKKRSHKLG